MCKLHQEVIVSAIGCVDAVHFCREKLLTVQKWHISETLWLLENKQIVWVTDCLPTSFPPNILGSHRFQVPPRRGICEVRDSSWMVLSYNPAHFVFPKDACLQQVCPNCRCCRNLEKCSRKKKICVVPYKIYMQFSVWECAGIWECLKPIRFGFNYHSPNVTRKFGSRNNCLHLNHAGWNENSCLYIWVFCLFHFCFCFNLFIGFG